MAASDPSYFADFEQVKKISSHLQTLNKSKISSHFADFEQ